MRNTGNSETIMAPVSCVTGTNSLSISAWVTYGRPRTRHPETTRTAAVTLCLMTAFVLTLLAFSSGCVSSAAKDQARDTAAAHDVYAALIESTLNGSIKKEDGLPVTVADLAATPRSVQELLANTVRALYLSRRGWHQAAFALGVGPDPKTLKLDPPTLGSR